LLPCGDIEPDPIQISDDGDHVGTVQYSLTESSCVEASNLYPHDLRCDQAWSSAAYVLSDRLQSIMDVAQLSGAEESVTRG